MNFTPTPRKTEKNYMYNVSYLKKDMSQTCSFEKIFARSGEQASEFARKKLSEPDEWVLVGVEMENVT